MKLVRKSKKDVVKGDHILVHRGFYWHHGIYVGDGNLIHKTAGKSTLKAAVFSADISVFDCGGGISLTDWEGFCPESEPDIHIVQYTACFAPEDTVALAASLVDHESQRYRLLESNCEHFAMWCKTGQHMSLQVRAVMFALSQVGAVTAGAVAGTATLARLDMGQMTTTETVRKKGNMLGLGAKKVVTQTTEVHTPTVLVGAGLFGVAAGLTYAGVRKLQAVVKRRRHMHMMLHLETDSTIKVALTAREGRVEAKVSSNAPPVAPRQAMVQRCRRFKSVAALHGHALSHANHAMPPHQARNMCVKDVQFFHVETQQWRTVEDVQQLPEVVSVRAMCSYKQQAAPLPHGVPAMRAEVEALRPAKVARK